jgi:diguanylate cyclase (GGDEF)-like protein/PAS domain S-box-containing protein
MPVGTPVQARVVSLLKLWVRAVDSIEMTEDSEAGVLPVDALDALDALVQNLPGALFCALADDGFRIPTPASLELSVGQIIPVPADRATMTDLVVPADRMVVVTTWERARSAGIAMGMVRTVHEPEQYVTLTILDARPRHGVWIGALTEGDREDLESSQSALAGALLVPLRPRTATILKNMFAVMTEIDDRTTRMLGWSSDDMVGIRSLEFIHPDDQERAVTNWMDLLSSHESQRVRYRHRCADESWLWVEVEHVYGEAEDLEDVVVAAHISDISDEMAAHESVHRSEQLLRRLAESLPAGVLQVDTDRHVVFANASLSRILGTAGATSLDDHFATVVPSDRVALDDAFAAVLDDGVDHELEVQARLRDTLELRRCVITLTALTDQEGAPGAIVCVNDTTESARMREELRVQATFDALTGCYNRASIMTAIDRALGSSDRLSTAVIFIDLDKFKPVNDTLGHSAGDELLVNVAERLKELLRADDIVGRIGGDEFLLVCPGLERTERAVTIAERIAHVLRGSIQLSSGVVQVQASIGVAFSGAESTSDSLVAQADTAMYESKRRGRGLPVTFDDATGAAARRTLIA